jgi:hypothetical protein
MIVLPLEILRKKYAAKVSVGRAKEQQNHLKLILGVLHIVKESLAELIRAENKLFT